MPQPRGLKPRLDRVEGKRRAAAGKSAGAAVRRRRLLRIQAAMGGVIRDALASAGVDIKAAKRLSLADDATAALAAMSEGREPSDADMALTPPPNRLDARPAEAFAKKIRAMTADFARGRPLDFANASFAELFAWSLAQGSQRGG